MDVQFVDQELKCDYILCIKKLSFSFQIIIDTITVNMSRIVRKPDFCLGENKGADQLRGNRYQIQYFFP